MHPHPHEELFMRWPLVFEGPFPPFVQKWKVQPEPDRLTHRCHEPSVAVQLVLVPPLLVVNEVSNTSTLVGTRFVVDDPADTVCVDKRTVNHATHNLAAEYARNRVLTASLRVSGKNPAAAVAAYSALQCALDALCDLIDFCRRNSGMCKRAPNSP